MPDTMSRGYSKLYNRKLNNVSQTSIQFDKLFHENSNRPSAAKSAGTVGKWGVISCTSLRSTGFNGRRDEASSIPTSKKIRLEYSNRNSASSKDPFSFDSEPDGGQNKPLGEAVSPVKPVVKPKKFFKSRNADSAPNEDVRLGASLYRNPEFSHQGSKKYGRSNSHGSKLQSSVSSKKFFTTSALRGAGGAAEAEQTEAMNLTSPTKAPTREENKPLPREEHKPPIVLRIFKGTSHLVSEACVPPLKITSDSNGSIVVRAAKRRHHTSSCDREPIWESAVSHETSITSPKKSTKEAKVADPWLPKQEVETSSPVHTQPPDTAANVFSTSNLPLEQMEVEANQEEPTVRCEDETEGQEEEEEPEFGVCADESNMADTQELLPSSLDQVDAIPAAPIPVSDLVATVEPAVAPELPVFDEEDRAKLQRAEELLSDTFVDFNSAAEKLLADPSQAKLPSQIPVTTRGHDWFSDSDDSDDIADQINTIAAAQESETQALQPEVSMKENIEEEVKVSEREEHVSSQLPKKGSIFKSRSLLSGGSRKRLALYKHKWADDKASGPGSSPSEGASTMSASQPVDEEFVPSDLVRVRSWPLPGKTLDEEEEVVTSVKCPKKAKGFYTVVRNVKKAHQIQESGEFQEFNDDVEYILDALQNNNPIGIRCLSAIKLASKCMAPAFRMHVRAHGTVAKFFRALHDAPKDQSLGLCTATVMFVLSQDRLNMDLDRHSLELMLNLLESDASAEKASGPRDPHLQKNRDRVRELCAEMQAQGHAQLLDLDHLAAGQLAMESLLSLTSRRAGEWFKEELRQLGGLDHIVATVRSCCADLPPLDTFTPLWTPSLLDHLRKAERCLRVLENVTNQNEENQLYLLRLEGGVLVDTLVRLYRQCDSEMPLHPATAAADKESTGVVLREVLLSTLKVLINLTHDFNDQPYGSTVVGQREGIVDASLHLLLQGPNYVPEDKKFDLLVLALILLINMMEHNPANRQILFNARAPSDPENLFDREDKTAVEALITLFYQQEEMARLEESKTDAILDGKKDGEQPEKEATPKSQEEFIEETVAKLLQKAGRNMEHTLIGAYVGLLMGYIIMDSADRELFVRQCLPEHNFQVMVAVLQKVYNFMKFTTSAVGSSRGIAQTERVINYLAQSDTKADMKRTGSSSCYPSTISPVLLPHS